MRYLFDTCTLVWFANNETKRLSETALQVITATGNEGIVSVASLLELAMKALSGKINFPSGSAIALTRRCDDEGIAVAPLTVEDIQQFLLLPPIHKDPFDRLLAAITTGPLGPCPIVTPDPAFDAYAALGVNRIW